MMRHGFDEKSRLETRLKIAYWENINKSVVRSGFLLISFRFNSLQLLDFCVVKLIFLEIADEEATIIFYKYFKIILLMESFVFNILLGAVFESMNDKFVSDPTLVFKRIQSREVKLSKKYRRAR